MAGRSRSRPTSSTSSIRRQATRVVRYTDYAAEKVRTLYPTATELRAQWADPGSAPRSSQRLAERGISFDELAEAAQQPDADPFDLLCHLAFNAPLRTRRERAQQLDASSTDFFERIRPRGPRRSWTNCWRNTPSTATPQFVLPDVLKCRRSPTMASVADIIRLFGGADQLRAAVDGTPEACSMPRRSPDGTPPRKPSPDHRPVARQPAQIRARHHAQGQGAERRP